MENSKNFILYSTTQGKLEVLLQYKTLWLTQKAIAKLFGVDRSVVTKHLINVYEEGGT